MSTPHTEWLTISYAPDGKNPKDYRIVLVDGEPLVYRPEVDEFGARYYDEDASHDREVLCEAVRQLREIKKAVAEFPKGTTLTDIFAAARLWGEHENKTLQEFANKSAAHTPPPGGIQVEANTAPIASEGEA